MGLVNWVEELKDAREYGFEKLSDFGLQRKSNEEIERDRALKELQDEVKRKTCQVSLHRRAHRRGFAAHESLIEETHYLYNTHYHKKANQYLSEVRDTDIRLEPLRSTIRLLDHKLKMYSRDHKQRKKDYENLLLFRHVL